MNNKRKGRTRATTIKTYTGESFRDRYIPVQPNADALLKADFGAFFIVRVDELIRLISLPVPPLRTGNHTLIYLTDGEAVMTIGSETYKIFKDECLVVPAGQVFSFDTIDINQGYLCNFHTDFLIGKFGKAELLNDFEFLRVWGNPRISLPDQTSGFVAQLLNRLLLNYAGHGLANLDIIQSYLLAVLCEINSVYQPVSVSTQTQAVTITNRFKELLFANSKTTHLVTDYAALLHITPNHLAKTVRTITGKSPAKWIDEAIVLEAKILLYQSTLSIGEVAAEVGLSDPSYFSRLFKKLEGVTPLAFRRMIETS